MRPLAASITSQGRKLMVAICLISSRPLLGMIYDRLHIWMALVQELHYLWPRLFIYLACQNSSFFEDLLRSCVSYRSSGRTIRSGVSSLPHSPMSHVLSCSLQHSGLPLHLALLLFSFISRQWTGFRVCFPNPQVTEHWLHSVYSTGWSVTEIT